MRDTADFASRTRRVDVCVCTYDRPQLIEALRSIDQQTQLVGWTVRVVVADNHPEPKARDLVQTAAAALKTPLTYVHAPARNISIARNACLDAVDAEYAVFLDDDETAEPDWLARLLAEAERGGWDAVLGRVDASYDEAATPWVRRGDFHSVRPVWVGGEILTGYTCNVLLRVASLNDLRFDPAFGRSGGEDVDFFYRLTDRGGRIGYAADAVVHDPVPADRTRFHWLLKRRFRSGQSHGERLVRQYARPPMRLVQIAVAAAKATAYGLMCLISAPDPVRRRRAMLGAALHAGVVARLAGARPIELY